jgi:RNA polymerase sigma-54 factor
MVFAYVLVGWDGSFRSGFSRRQQLAHQATYELRARQQTSLTPRLQQSVKLLQMSALEFTREIEQALATNPFLEDSEDEGNTGASTDDTAMAAGPAEVVLNDTMSASAELQAPALTEAPPEVITELPELHDMQGEYSGDYPAARASGDGDSDVGQWARSMEDLRDRLSSELCSYRLAPRDRLMAEYIIEGLDEEGYLRTELTELAGEGVFDPMPEPEEWEVALKLVQQLDVPGLAARNLAECLKLQLAAMEPDTAGRDLAMHIVEHELERLGKHDFSGLARACQCPDDDLRQACALIRRLDPRPGLRYAKPDSSYVVPDVVVQKFNGQWIVTPNRAAMPRARLHRAYADLFRNARYSDRSPMAQELQEARWLIRNVEQRYSTIQRVAEAIVLRQQTFFEYGEIALRPLMLREIADELEIHESTVSRATSNKYMATPRGIFEFKHFFSRELYTDTGGSCSAAAVRALIKEMIDGEDANTPLSDVDLAQMLGKQGVVVARRTVSKYRGQLKYPPAEMRRQY